MAYRQTSLQTSSEPQGVNVFLRGRTVSEHKLRKSTDKFRVRPIFAKTAPDDGDVDWASVLQFCKAQARAEVAGLNLGSAHEWHTAAAAAKGANKHL